MQLQASFITIVELLHQVLSDTSGDALKKRVNLKSDAHVAGAIRSLLEWYTLATVRTEMPSKEKELPVDLNTHRLWQAIDKLFLLLASDAENGKQV